MPAATFLFGVKKARIGTIEIDADPLTVHDLSWTVSQHPVEGDSPITDHRFQNPKRIELDAEISNVTASNSITDQNDERVRAAREVARTGRNRVPETEWNYQRAGNAWDALQELAHSEEPITVITSLEEVDDMQITQLRATRSTEKGQVLAFHCVVEQVRRVFSETVDAVSETPRKERPTAKRKNTEEATAAQAEKAAAAETFKPKQDLLGTFF